MKRLAVASLLVLVCVLLTACGGGSGSSSSGTAGNSEKEWIAETGAVMTEGEKTVDPAEEKINAATTRAALEAAYRNYATQLGAVASKLDSTEAPRACASVKSHVVGFLREFGAITGELGHQSGLDEKKFDALVGADTKAGQTFAATMERIASRGHC
jgi:ABC-type glycerol-3-phosphate transport system substrate-binding protein